MGTTTTRISAALGALILALSMLAAITAGAAFADEHDEGDGDGEGQPARGSISINDIPFDDEAGNEVKVGCDPFAVDFFGFAEQEDVPVTFTLWAPHEEQVEVWRTTVDLDEARGNERSAELVIGTMDSAFGEALIEHEPVEAEDFDYKLRVDVVVKHRGEEGEVTKSAMLFIDCPELAAAAAGDIADEGAEGDDEDTPTPVGAVGAGTGPTSPASGSSLIILVTLLAVASVGAALGVRRRTVGG